MARNHKLKLWHQVYAYVLTLDHVVCYDDVAEHFGTMAYAIGPCMKRIGEFDMETTKKVVFKKDLHLYR